MSKTEKHASRQVMPAMPKMDIPPSYSADAVLPITPRPARLPQQRLIIVGASTGGTEALKQLLLHLPGDSPAVLIAQHMPAAFTKTFAARLDTISALHVKEAEDGEPVLPGHAYIAPGHMHLLLSLGAGGYQCELSDAAPVNRHRPSVDVLFRSAANVGRHNVVGVILTGMGRDGAAGMLEMKRAGAYTIAQDEASCVVFGMPKEAIALGGADEILPLDSIAPRLVAMLRGALPKAGDPV
ncbi:chemotaxis protein CheB [Chitinimonas sp. BJYL2]|uniref:chemotaxis protein CheB n=1 Tax=Chitinimonas sp. BJYL2 TaxID=2976696 RepID=UPI0027E5B5FC|nr:chemotaxis protein CheB [Chitinimonas sp. BJYL2]